MTTLSERIGGAKRVVGGPFGSKLTSADYTSNGVPVIRGSNMEQNGRWIGGEFAFVSSEKVVSDLRSNLARRGDIIVTQRGTMGQVSIVPDDAAVEEFVISQSQMAISVDPECASRDFVYYYLRSPAFAEYLDQSIIQTGVPHINLGILRQSPANWPALEVQEEIASRLVVLDEKIELNRRMNETLEAMAQAIFRDWFVDFGPVCRKLAGATDPVEIMGGVTTDPEQAAEMAGLFPSEMDKESVPTGWFTKPLEHIATFTKGRSYKSAELADSPVALVTLKSFSRGGGYRFDGLKSYTGEYKPNQVVGLGDIVMSLTDVTQAAELIGRPAIVSDGGEFTTLVASLDVMIIRAINAEDTPREYLFQALMDRRFTEHALAHTTGTTVLHLDKAALPSFEILVPPGEVARKYDAICGLFREKILGNDRQSQALAETRDYLLPRLMSGEVRVGEAAKEIAA